MFLDDDFWKIAGCIVAGTAAYFIGKSSGQNKMHEKYERDREIEELRAKIRVLENKNILPPPPPIS